MKQLRAVTVYGPEGKAFLVGQTNGETEIYWTEKELMKAYSRDLLDILNKENTYKSPKQPENQLYLFTDENEDMN